MYATAQEYKPGIPTEELIAAGREAVAAPELEVLGLMSHLGRHRSDLETWRAYAAQRRRDRGRAGRPHGTAGSRASSTSAAATHRRATPTPGCTGATSGRRGRPRSKPSSRRSRAASAAGLAGRVPLAGVALEIEPGRALHADTGIHLTRVVNLKRQSEPLAWRWVETDTTEMFLLDLLVEHCRFPVVAATRMGEPAADPVDVVGCSCGFDVIAPQVRLPAGRAGRHARVPGHGRLRGCVRGQLQRPAAARDRARQRRGGRDRAPRRDDRGRLRARRHPGALAAVTVLGIDHAGITVASVDGRARLLSRPARPARDRRGRGRRARAGCDHRA